MPSEPNALDNHDALLVVDVQRDFCPGGALPIPQGDEVVPVLNQWIEVATACGALVCASRDWHPKQHMSFADEGGPWPTHCQQDTPGAAFHSDLQLPGDAIVVSKGVRFDNDQYSVFDETGLAQFLLSKGIRRLWVGGLAQDVCVKATALDGIQHGFEVHLIANATKPVAEDDGHAALEAMKRAGVIVEATDAPTVA